jgi:hypothetical protein
MSQFGEAEPGLSPARLSRINCVVDILKGKGNTYIKGSKILIPFKIVRLPFGLFQNIGTFSILCTRVDRITKGRNIRGTNFATVLTEFIAGRSLTTHSSYRSSNTKSNCLF